MKYKKKPVEIEAMQWTGDNLVEISAFMTHGRYDAADKTIKIDTLEGTMSANVGDYIIKGVKGEFYPCKPDIFMQTYVKVIEETEKTIYKDCNGQIIGYGDILKLKDYIKDSSEYAPKEPFFVFTKKGVYISGMDEYAQISECKITSDEADELGAFEILVPRNIYEEVIR